MLSIIFADFIYVFFNANIYICNFVGVEEDNKFLKQPAICEVFDHDDIVKCISCYEGRVYTGGYDGYICIYEATIVTSSKVSSNTGILSSKSRAKTGRNRRTPSPIRRQASSRLRFSAPPIERVDKKRAHDAGIVTMSVLRDSEGNVWIFTGSFDKSLKIWNRDCKLVHQLVGFVGAVSGVSYVPKTKSLWAVSGSSQVQIYEPKSGDNVSYNKYDTNSI